MTKQNRIDQHLLAVMTPGREYTANDVANRIGISPEDVQPHLTRMAKAGLLKADRVNDGPGWIPIYSRAALVEEGR